VGTGGFRACLSCMRHLVAVSLCAVLGGTARADVDTGTVKLVTGRLAGTTAVLDVRFVAVLEGPTVTSGQFRLALPRGVVTGATAGGHVLDLVPAERANLAMGTLGARPEGPDRRFAVAIRHVQQGSVDIDIAAPGSTPLAIDLKVTTPTCFVRDRRYVAVPKSWEPGLAPALRVAHAGVVELACTPPDEDHVWVGFASPALARRASGIDRIGGTASRLALGDTHVAKVELDLAARLSDLPADLATAILVDSSRSMSARMLDAQRQVIASYLRTAPQSQIQVIAFARTARALLPAWTPASQATARVDRELRALTRTNGSNLDAALREASVWLGRAKGTRRIVIVSDDALPERLTVDRLQRIVPANTLVNVVSVRDDFEGLVRDDEGLLSRLAGATRGISVRAGGTALDATMLVRPTTFDRVVMKAPGWKTLDVAVPTCFAIDDSIAEGAGCTWYGEGRAIAGPIIFEGYLWGERVVRVVHPDLVRANELARELSVAPPMFDRSEVVQRQLVARLERAARAVNGVWSLYAEWGGRDGYGDLGLFGFGRSGGVSMCLGCGDGVRPVIHVGSLGSSTHLVDQLRRAIATCTPDRPVHAVVEITLEEIVDVAVVVTGAGALRTCVEEAIWNTWLVTPAASPRVTLSIDG